MRNNFERQRLQYDLVSHARGLRFSEVEVIDDDLGISGSGVHREGFERLLTAVCNKSVGLVLAIETSGLSGTAVTGTRFWSSAPSSDAWSATATVSTTRLLPMTGPISASYVVHDKRNHGIGFRSTKPNEVEHRT